MTPRVYHRSFLVFFFPDRITNFAYTARVFFFCSFFAFIQSASPLIIVWSANFFSCRMAFKSQIDKKGKETKTKRALFNFCLVSNEEEEADSVSLPLFLYNYVSSFLFIYYRVVGRRTCLFKYTPCLCVCVCVDIVVLISDRSTSSFVVIYLLLLLGDVLYLFDFGERICVLEDKRQRNTQEKE